MGSCITFGLLLSLFANLIIVVIGDVSHLPNVAHTRESVVRIVHEYSSKVQPNNNFQQSVNYSPSQKIESQAQTNYNIRIPDIDLRPPEPQPATIYNQQNNYNVNQIEQATTLQQSTSFEGPKYLPPPQQTQQHQQIPSNQYLPPSQNHQHAVNTEYSPLHPSSQQQVQHNDNFQGPKYLPPSQNFQNHGTSHIPQEIRIQPTYSEFMKSVTHFSTSPAKFTYQAPTYLPPTPSSQNYQQVQQTETASYNQPAQATLPLSVALPEGYDFVKPAGAEAAIAELHTLPADATPIQASVQSNAVYQPDYRDKNVGKFRTVQIVNEAAVKTLKILETDEAGVRTIKILGQSHENPTGDHRVVKVQVPGAHIQTVRVYNDQKDVSHSQYNINHYLPPNRDSWKANKRSVRIANEAYHTALLEGYESDMQR